ncbi:MAG: hypothetical protein HY036_05460 [Nitrospirae bacterium]|nr:hypothetical protein [Nitrospirota bacterium]
MKFFVKNTSTGPIQIRSGIDTAAITWSYPTNGAGLDHFGATALLKTIKIGTTTVWSGSAVTSGTNVTFSSTVNLSALQKGIPMELLFVNNGGSALSVDMTGESIGISMTYGTSTDGGSTFNNTCSWSTGSSSIIVSEGPVIKIKSLQMQTAITPLVYGVTSAGTYTLPPYTVSTYFSTGTVFTAGTPGSMISSAKVYYCKQSWSVMTSTPPPQNSACWTTSQPSLSPLSMTLTPNLTDGSANIDWSATKTAGKVILENGSPYRVWYYLQVTDNLGNISSEPVYSNGTFNAYTYDQYDGFVPGLTLTWSSKGSGPGTKSVVISGSVPDALGSTATTSGAAVSGTFQEVCAVGCSSYPFTTTLPLSNYTSGKVFTGTNDVIVTLTLTMAGFVTKNCTGDLPGNESSATLICP